MKRALAPLTWWAIGLGYTLALAVIVLPVTWLGSAAYLTASLTLVVATFVAARVHRVNRRFIAAVSAIGGFFAASQVVDSLGDSGGFTRASDLLALCGSMCIILALVNMLSGRASANLRSVLGDALIVGLGSWLISWVALVEPALRHRGGSLVSSILAGAYQPAGTVVLFLLVLLLFSGSGNRQPSVWLVTLAMLFNLAGDVLWGMNAAGHFGDGVIRIAMALYVAAYFTAAGAFIHPTVVLLKRPATSWVNSGSKSGVPGVESCSVLSRICVIANVLGSIAKKFNIYVDSGALMVAMTAPVPKKLPTATA